MSQQCYPCVLSEIIRPVGEYQAPVEQDNQWSNYLKAVSNEFISKMKVPFGTYPKTKFFVYTTYKQRPLFHFFSSITSDERAIAILKQMANENEIYANSPYSIIKEIAGAETLLYYKERVYKPALTKWQKEFILENEGKLEVKQLSKILDVSHSVIYSYRRQKGLAKKLKYHGNRKRQETLI